MKNKILSLILAVGLLVAAVPAAAADDGKTVSAVSAAFKAEAHKALASQVSYPVEAEEAGIEGVVGVRIWVSPKNIVRRVQVIRSSGSPILDNEVVKAAYRTTFPVKGWTEFETKINFSLKDE
ncbi:energy transducer TonB [Neisseria chenwenguii]|uniref:energy transducer TonB n=1 Tax=Neisseria chenwenguii TaxID=1853278 RepID=UPI000F4F5218|nr:energy transducer TonB [Neisseria chenwenguii]ROV55804.1 energy transducer TonB [Neisseria chenwenguii]